MSIRFLHTADWQLGKPFAAIDDPQKRAALQAERIAVIGRIASIAQAQAVEFVLVAGDLFDSVTPTRSLVAQACAAIAQLRVPVFVIPGNHDHGGANSVYRQPFFQQESAALAPNLRVLLERTPVVTEHAIIYPCPLLRRHETTDVTEWLRQGTASKHADLPRIILAHGTTHDFSSHAVADEEDGGDAVNVIDLSRLPGADFDYIALGDWHGTRQVADKAWFAGTPELDRFLKGGAHDPGNVLIVEAARGLSPRVTPVRTGRIGWHEVAFTFSEDASLEHFVRLLEEKLGGRAQQDVLSVRLDGRLGMQAMLRLDQLRETHDARLLRLKWEARVAVAPTDEEALQLTQRVQDPLISRVARHLVDASRAADPAEANIAREALRSLYVAVQQGS